MNNVSYNFTYTTADEQRSYFFGELQYYDNQNCDENILLPGNYRVIDGNLSRIVSGPTPEQIKTHFDNISKQKND